MSSKSEAASLPEPQQTSPFRAGIRLFLISFLVLFLELACIRWFPAHVLYLTFFTNMVLLACFLGMSLGCLAAGRAQNYLTSTPLLLIAALAFAHGLEHLSGILAQVVDVGHQASPQAVFFGTETSVGNPFRFAVPIEALGGFFFLLIALALVGPGQELGRAFTLLPNRILAYTWNVLGSLTGIVLFAACSWYELSPGWWFLIVVLALALFLAPGSLFRWLVLGPALAAVVWLGGTARGPFTAAMRTVEQLWSPYYRIDYDPAPRKIAVNLIGHQQMVSRQSNLPSYALPHLLNRDAGGKPFANVLVIGAGSGNDVSRALQWGAEHVDAVEIDPVIQGLGQKHHPDHPYDDPRVTVHLDDGRNFLRSSTGKYDLIVYALVDSLVLHSGYSNIQLESFLFTRQAFADIRRHLAPGGLFVSYNFFRWGWVAARLHQDLRDAFGAEPLVLNLPSRDVIDPDHDLFNQFTVFCVGDTRALEERFTRHKGYWLRMDRAAEPSLTQTPNGFEEGPALHEQKHFYHLNLTRMVPPSEPLRPATDDWPFLYLRRPMVPDLSLRGMAIMGGLGVLLVLWFLPRSKGESRRWSFDGGMFFLGAGFMLIETKAVVQMALLFGSTWMVNSVVVFAVLVMILAANLYVRLLAPRRLWPYYLAILIALALNAVIPLDFFLGMNRTVQMICSCLLVFAPIFFAGVVFAVAFARSQEPDRAFGANVAGAMLGGLAEYTSMLLGFQYVILLGLLFYLLSMVLMKGRGGAVPAVEKAEAAA